MGEANWKIIWNSLNEPCVLIGCYELSLFSLYFFCPRRGKNDVNVKLHESAIMSHTTSLHFIHICSLLPLNSMWQRSDFICDHKQNCWPT